MDDSQIVCTKSIENSSIEEEAEFSELNLNKSLNIPKETLQRAFLENLELENFKKKDLLVQGQVSEQQKQKEEEEEKSLFKRLLSIRTTQQREFLWKTNKHEFLFTKPVFRQEEIDEDFGHYTLSQATFYEETSNLYYQGPNYCREEPFFYFSKISDDDNDDCWFKSDDYGNSFFGIQEKLKFGNFSNPNFQLKSELELFNYFGKRNFQKKYRKEKFERGQINELLRPNLRLGGSDHRFASKVSFPSETFPTRITWEPNTFQSIRDFLCFKDRSLVTSKQKLLANLADFQKHRIEESRRSLSDVYNYLLEYYQCFPDRLSCYKDEVMKVRIQYHFASPELEKTRRGPLHGYGQSYLEDKVYKNVGLEYFPETFKTLLCSDRYWDLRLRRPYSQVFYHLLFFCNQKVPFALDFFINRHDFFMVYFKSCFRLKSVHRPNSQKGKDANLSQFYFFDELIGSEGAYDEASIQSLGSRNKDQSRRLEFNCKYDPDKTKIEALAEDLINFIILKGGNLEKWLILRKKEIEIKIRAYSEVDFDLYHQRYTYDFKGFTEQTKLWVYNGFVPEAVIGDMFLRNKRDRIEEVFFDNPKITWHQVYFLSTLLNLEEQSRKCRFFLAQCPVFEDLRKSFCFSKLEQQQLNRLTISRFARFLVQHFLQNLIINFDCLLYNYYGNCLSTIAQDGGLFSKKVSSSYQQLESFLKSVTKLECSFATHKQQDEDLRDDYSKQSDFLESYNKMFADDENDLPPDDYLETESKDQSVEQKSQHDEDEESFGNASKDSSDNRSEEEKFGNIREEQVALHTLTISFFKLEFYIREWSTEYEGLRHLVSQLQEFDVQMSYKQMKYHLENFRDLFMLTSGEFHIGTNCGTISGDSRKLETWTSSYRIFQDTIPPELINICSFSSSRRMLKSDKRLKSSPTVSKPRRQIHKHFYDAQSPTQRMDQQFYSAATDRHPFAFQREDSDFQKEDLNRYDRKRLGRKKVFSETDTRQAFQSPLHSQTDGHSELRRDSESNYNIRGYDHNQQEEKEEKQQFNDEDRADIYQTQHSNHSFLRQETRKSNQADYDRSVQESKDNNSYGSSHNRGPATKKYQSGYVDDDYDNGFDNYAPDELDSKAEFHAPKRFVCNNSKENYQKFIAKKKQVAQPIRNSVLFFSIWKHDKFKRTFDRILFSRNDELELSENHTPSYIEDLYKPEVRYVFNQHRLTKLTHPGEEYQVGSAELFLKLFNTLIQDELDRNYLLNWIAHLIQNPDSRIVGNCLVLLSRFQGTGKSTLVNCIADLLSSYAKKITNLYEELFNNFTSIMKNTFLIVIDDSNSETFQRHFEGLKHLITADYTRIRELYERETKVKSHGRFIIVSNNEDLLPIEEDERRYSVFETTNLLKGNTKFFEKFKAYWDQRKNRRAVLFFFLNYKIDPGWHPERSYRKLNSKLKKQLEAQKIAPLHVFCYSFALAFIRKHYQNISVKDHLDIQSRPFLVAYRNWLLKNQEEYPSEFKKVNQKRFPKQLRSLNILNTRDLPQKKDYRAGAFYRMQLLPFAKKALEYEFELLEEAHWPSNFVRLKCK